MARTFSFSSAIAMASVIVGAVAVAGCAVEPAAGERTSDGKDALTCSSCGGGGGGGDPASTGGTGTYCTSSGTCSVGFYTYNTSDSFEMQLKSKCAYPRYYNTADAYSVTTVKVARCWESPALDNLVASYASSRHAQEIYTCTTCLDEPAPGYVYVQWDPYTAFHQPICPSGCMTAY